MKRECKLENRINGLEIKAEPDVDVHRTEEYPTSLDEYFQRTNAQMFMLQVRQINMMRISIRKPKPQYKCLIFCLFPVT